MPNEIARELISSRDGEERFTGILRDSENQERARGFLVSIHDSVFAISANAFVVDLCARPRAL